MSQSKPKNIAIVGGSLGGLLTGVALKRLRKDLNIRIFERNPTPLLQDQGAGVVAGQDVQKFFKTYDRTQTPLTVRSHQRLYLDKSGKSIDRENKEQQMTSWDLLYHLLRTNYDGTQTDYAKVPKAEDGEGKTSYEYGYTVTKIEAPMSSSAAQLDFSEPVKVTFQHHSGETSTTDADLVIAADGPSSTIRKEYYPDVKRKYAGYVAWRGTVPEDQVSQAAADVFVEKFPFYHTEGIQILAYTIPAKYGVIEPGKRLLNWVWYVNYKEESPEHIKLMTDKDGNRHHITLPPGGITDDVWARQKEIAKEILPPQFAELVNKTEVPFIQAITDVIAPSAILSGGRVLLLGDALAGFRPHTAASTNQAALDAMKLAIAVEKILEGGGIEALKEWEDQVGEYARTMQSHGVSMGDRSQFGEHPLSR
jgi:2-polyprenyl-6-methoxyphenol hydroxylase-like FAD-dependent oxidoreductase